jgi:predicted nucleotidyltransferase
MIPLVANHAQAISALCRRHGVIRLDLFGSAAIGTFDAAQSDLDFVAEFANPAPTAEYADRFLDFAAGLEAVLGRRVDVVSATALRGSRLAQAIVSARQRVYVESAPAAV